MLYVKKNRISRQQEAHHVLTTAVLPQNRSHRAGEIPNVSHFMHCILSDSTTTVLRVWMETCSKVQRPKIIVFYFLMGGCHPDIHKANVNAVAADRRQNFFHERMVSCLSVIVVSAKKQISRGENMEPTKES